MDPSLFPLHWPGAFRTQLVRWRREGQHCGRGGGAGIHIWVFIQAFDGVPYILDIFHTICSRFGDFWPWPCLNITLSGYIFSSTTRRGSTPWLFQGCWAVGFSRSEVAGSPKSCQEVHLSRGSCEVVEEVGFFPDGPMQRWNDDFTCVVLLLVERNMMCFFWFEIKGHRKKCRRFSNWKRFIYCSYFFFLFF